MVNNACNRKIEFCQWSHLSQISFHNVLDSEHMSMLMGEFWFARFEHIRIKKKYISITFL